jgi:cell division protein FtsZ
MTELSRTNITPPAIKVLGLGGAGQNVLDRVILDGLEIGAIALNTDMQALNASIAPEKVHLGREATRGLGTGGDPELGYSAAEEATEEISAAIAGAQIVFLCAGLGGGTGSGAAPIVAHLARKAGAVVVAFVTLPFSFEGKRRAAQAAESLAQLEQQTDLVVCFENDRMGDAVAPTAGVQQAFSATDLTLSQGIRAIASFLGRSGLMGIGLDDLAAVLRRQGARSLFGHGESDGANRAHEALERALKSPLMDRGRMLADAQAVLVQISGGNDLTLNEVTVLMNEFNRHISDGTRIHFGVTTDARLGRRLCMTILSSLGGERVAAKTAPQRQAVPISKPASAPREEFHEPAPQHALQLEHELGLPMEADDEPTVPPTPAVTRRPAVAAKVEKPAPTPAKKEPKVEQMALEPANRGRFEKAEPTIVDGQDLDVPTFMRKNLKVR